VANSPSGSAIVSYHWDFGDGVSVDGREVSHAYTEPGEYTVSLTAAEVDRSNAEQRFQVRISGYLPTTFNPQNFKRYQPSK
jgi:hypothetical protein